MNPCNNICERYRAYPNQHERYEYGNIAYCKNCVFMYYKEDIKNFRCPCCKTIIRTHKRTNHGRKKEVHRY